MIPLTAAEAELELKSALMQADGITDSEANRLVKSIPSVRRSADGSAAALVVDGEDFSTGTGGGGGGGDEVGQFGLVQGGVVTTPYRVTSTGTPVGLSGPCLVESVKCITVGTTTPPALHDDVDAATAAQKRWTRAIADLTAGALVPVANGGLMTFENGVYFTCPSGGEYIINAIVEA